MISTGNVSLREARADCSISANGPMVNVEFADRHKGTGYSLTQLRGHVCAFSSKVVTGSYPYNYNPGSACRNNYAEANVYSVNGRHSMDLTKEGSIHKARGGNYDGYDVLGGFSYCGTIPSGSRTYKYNFAWTTPLTGGPGSIELIGWTSGYFSGTPKYYISWQGTADQYARENPVTLDGSYPYITLCLQALGGIYLSEMRATEGYIKA